MCVCTWKFETSRSQKVQPWDWNSKILTSVWISDYGLSLFLAEIKYAFKKNPYPTTLTWQLDFMAIRTWSKYFSGRLSQIAIRRSWQNNYLEKKLISLWTTILFFHSPLITVHFTCTEYTPGLGTGTFPSVVILSLV